MFWTPARLPRAYAHFPSGVVAVCPQVDGEPVGMAVSAFVPVSLDPPLLGICIQSSATTWPRQRRADSRGLCSLSRGQPALARKLSAKDSVRLAGPDYELTESEAMLMIGARLGFESCNRDLPRPRDCQGSTADEISLW
jgi:flavin reductase (DIM6/NTAB) family NADH-FMN oxidoreductase RutF